MNEDAAMMVLLLLGIGASIGAMLMAFYYEARIRVIEGNLRILSEILKNTLTTEQRSEIMKRYQSLHRSFAQKK